MMYAPHTLMLRTVSKPIRDEFDNVISDGVETLTEICKCRCDENSTKEFTTENGTVYRPAYHIVAENVSLKAGDYIKCMNGEEVRGEGKIYQIKKLNFLNYSEIWV